MEKNKELTMPTLNLLSILIFIVSSINAGADHAQLNHQNSWAKRVERGNEVTTTLQFYFHNIPNGPGPTSVRIAEAAQTNSSRTFFGALMMIDDPLTVGPDPSSRIVGRARGLMGSAGLNKFTLIMAVSYVFTDGIYNGSSFSLLSINEVLRPAQEMAVVGGTGLFRLARGHVVARTHSIDAMSVAIVEYNVTIATYDYSKHPHE
ncbi:dirigent protein 23-like [Salvia miltiorrhiza]|uniref:dirigent protein 23-like n=1 Tax=Salvia miltiorrhiza TaxID=226208 RepID=UPI0025AD4B59|nr:dirigent protein 23-like [Salvia miltiorrhiza]